MKFKDKIKRLAKNTQKGYVTAVNRYESFHGLSMEELIDEALMEQENNVPPHKLKVIDRMESWQDHLVSDENLVAGTIFTYINKIKTIYYKSRVSLPYLEEIDPKILKRRPVISYSDVLSKKEIRDALAEMRPQMKARLMVMCQGGLSNEECEHLTTHNFINELFKYHQQEDSVEALKWLSKTSHPVIWVTMLVRQKTKKPYYSVIGPEAVNYIARAKLYEYNLPGNDDHVLSDKLLNSNKDSFGRVCRRVNDKLGYGKVASESKLRPHNLRRFHATRIKSFGGFNGLSNSEIDELQGRGKTSVQDTYIKTNPMEQKKIYLKVINNLTLFNNYYMIDDELIVDL